MLLGIFLAAAVAVLAYRAKALTRSGALAAWGVGAVSFGVGGWTWAAALLTFFGTSTALSRWRRRAKEGLGYEKGGRRDAGQVLANGGVAALCALLPITFPPLAWHTPTCCSWRPWPPQRRHLGDGDRGRRWGASV